MYMYTQILSIIHRCLSFFSPCFSVSSALSLSSSTELSRYHSLMPICRLNCPFPHPALIFITGVGRYFFFSFLLSPFSFFPFPSSWWWCGGGPYLKRNNQQQQQQHFYQIFASLNWLFYCAPRRATHSCSPSCGIPRPPRSTSSNPMHSYLRPPTTGIRHDSQRRVAGCLSLAASFTSLPPFLPSFLPTLFFESAEPPLP